MIVSQFPGLKDHILVDKYLVGQCTSGPLPYSERWINPPSLLRQLVQNLERFAVAVVLPHGPYKRRFVILFLQ